MEQHNEETIFKAAIKMRPSAERTAYVQQACGSNVDLLVRLETLLHAHDEAGDFLETSPFGAGVGPADPPVAEGPGTVIGRYKLLEKIGEGGMAVVYMAEQTEPLCRKVALKIIKLGMDTRQVIARFEAERQALALMDHPSIAKVLDAGATETGRPYFVMELVTGVSITEYCDKNSLSTKERLALFLQVCQAVQHAHQKGIIHRDIKPSNVMVTHHDGKPVPKVIDFGIAKATNQKLTEKTLFTRYAHIIGTPAYMSPEQAELSDLDIDTRSDIYSLGVLLYELLTGTTPFSEEELRKAGYIEMQRVIREQEPVKPSTKLSTLGKTLTEIARCRNCTPDLLRKAVRGDLDWIVMKSLEKDRDRRYGHVSTLAMDIERHLADETVLARAPSTAYWLHKLLRRHRAWVVRALALALLASALAIVLFLWNQYRIRLTEAQAAEDRKALTKANRQFARESHGVAFETLKPLLESKHVGAEAHLLNERILNAIREKVGYYTRKIETDPHDTESYLHRAQQYSYVHDDGKVYADMGEYAAILGQEWFSSVRFGPLANVGPAINSPIHDAGPKVSIDGLSLNFWRHVALDGLPEMWTATRATKDDPWGIPVSSGIWGDPAALFRSIKSMPSFTTADGLEIYFTDVEERRAGFGGWDIWMMSRRTIDGEWGPCVNLGPLVNTAADEVSPAVSADGLELYFSGFRADATYVRPGGYGGADLWVTRRATRNDPWGEPQNLGPVINSAQQDARPFLSADGRFLLFDSQRPGGYGVCDLYVARRLTGSYPWSKPVNLGPIVNSPAFEHLVYMSADGSTLYWNCERPGGHGSLDIWQVSVTGLEIDPDDNAHLAPDERRKGNDAGKEGVYREKK